MNVKKILIAVDSSPIAAHAADVGMELATALDASPALVHAFDPTLGGAEASGATPMELQQIARREASGLLDAIKQRWPKERAVLEFASPGNPATEIIKAAREWPADLIVIGSHGRKGLSRALLGSVAEAVLRQAPCPILVVRPEP